MSEAVKPGCTKCEVKRLRSEVNALRNWQRIAREMLLRVKADIDDPLLLARIERLVKVEDAKQ